MGVVAKMFVSEAKTSPSGDTTYRLGVVCRGEINKDWAAATPSGEAILADQVLDKVWADRQGGPVEVLVLQTPDPDGDWEMRVCSFTYNGCAVEFYRHVNGPPYGLKLALTVNAAPASQQLRDAYRAGLETGKAPRFRIEVQPDETGQA